MVVDGSSKKKNRKNKGNATPGNQEPQQQQQPNQNENLSQPQQQQQTEQKQRIQSPEIISDKQRTDLLLEASMHQSYNAEDVMKNESDDEKSESANQIYYPFFS